MLAAAGALCPALAPSQPQRPLRGHLESLHSPFFQRTSSLRQKVYAREAFYSALRAPTQLEESCFRRNVQLGRGYAGVVGSARKGCSRGAHHPAVPRAPGRAFPAQTPRQQLDRLPIRSLSLAQPWHGHGTAAGRGEPPPRRCHARFADKGAGCAQKRCQGPEPPGQPPLHGSVETLTGSPPYKLVIPHQQQYLEKKKNNKRNSHFTQ